jgi:hypothetical protein
VRGLARYREDAFDAAKLAPGIAGLVGAGNLTVTLESDDAAQRYQGIVPIGGERLADSLQLYFANSEQLPTRLWLHADAAGVSGMLLQRLPGVADPEGDVDDAWRRVQLIGETLTAEELATLADAEIIHRLFNEDDVRLFEPFPVYFRCRCSRERVSGVLQGLGEAETRAIVAERGEVEVRCDFCNRAYSFDAVDVEQLFKPSVASGAGVVDEHGGVEVDGRRIRRLLVHFIDKCRKIGVRQVARPGGLGNRSRMVVTETAAQRGGHEGRRKAEKKRWFSRHSNVPCHFLVNIPGPFPWLISLGADRRARPRRL